MSGPVATVWSGDQEGEFAQTTASDIADSTSNLLVDSSGNDIVDGGVSFTPIASTVWTINDTA